jgi:hypothetical protein
MDTLTNTAATSPPTSLAIYDSMVLAIDRCYQVDEVKDLRDKAMAFEHYARQAQNVEAERKAIEVRIRAERRAGQLLKDMERSPVAKNPKAFDDKKPSEPSPYARAKQDAHISENQAHRWQKLAEIPHETFEGKLQDPLVRPTTSGLLETTKTDSDIPAAFVVNGKPIQQAPDDALWLWGHLRDFERESYLEMDINEITDKLSDALKSDIYRLAPRIADWLNNLQ